ncbi:hypothetical protein [Saccharopolyspora shandongensis]|uniref:hypothetical protein n=1 Tax=Saccharopolyspora shandongensis TaxID=418495 RepID=UPI0033E5E94C
MVSTNACRRELERLYEDADFSAQSYFEAAKSAGFWARSIVFVPALLGACAALLVAVGAPKEWGALGAVAGAVAATSSFLGSTQRANSLLDSARKFTGIRHAARLELALASDSGDASALEAKLRSLRGEYNEIVLMSEPVPNRLFQRAAKRIRKGVLEYEKADLEA